MAAVQQILHLLNKETDKIRDAYTYIPFPKLIKLFFMAFQMIACGTSEYHRA
jgi:hypothetical protein